MNHNFQVPDCGVDPHSELPPEQRMRKKKPNYLGKAGKFILDVLLCRGDLDQEELQSKPVSYRELFRFADFHDKICIVLGSFFACVGGAVQPMVLVFGGMITSIFLKDRDNVGNQELVDDVRLWLVLLGVGGLIALISTYLQSWLLSRGCSNMVNTLRCQFLAAVLRQDAAWFGENNSGAITSLLNSNIERIEDGLSDKLGALLRGFSMFISSILVCLFINWQLTLIAVTMGPISAWTLGLLGKVVSKFAIQMQDAATEAAIVVEESIMNVRTVAACNAQEHMVKKYEKVLDTMIPPALKYNFWVGFFEGFSFVQIYMIMGITFWVGIYGYFNGWVTRGGDVILVVNTISLTGYYLGLLGPHMMAILKARIAAALIYETIDKKARKNFHPDEGIFLEKPRGDVEVHDVVFSYPTRDGLILKGISWEAKNGESIALVGKSGCGKSTSIGLLTRLYDVISGTIKIDGIPIEKINIRSLRQIIGIVEQEPCLFNGTVIENITLGRAGITVEDAHKAAQIARADEFINQLQHGYDTVLGVGGVALSGGQKQRIAIARAIATDPKILLLDEATSALDTESERIVQAALNRAAEGRTTVIIAHRLSTLKDVSRIYVLDNGKVIEEGTHDGLVAKGGIYAALAKAQEINQAGQVNNEDFGLSETMRASLRKSQRESKRKVSLLSVGTTESEEIDTNGQTGGGLWLLYSNMRGNIPKVLLALVCAILRGSEMPLLAVQCTLAFQAVQMENKDHYIYNGMITFLVATASGLMCWISQVGEYTFAGWAAEKIVAKLRIRALRSLLYRPLATFDQPHSSSAACVAKIAQHAPNCIPVGFYNVYIQNIQ